MPILSLPLTPMRLRHLILLVPAIALAVLAAGCDALVDRPGLALEFGAPYSVLFGESVTAANGLVQSTPFTDAGGALHVAVEFTGGCANHTFRADYTLAESAATIWLVHASNGDACEARLIEEVVVALPTGVLEKALLVLVSPSGREETIARFDAPIESP
ncbi:MAG: hypothetical protein IH855_01450 [Bacteroidetes bacterium]|nr:hypothetical protein [Bacteroidota bacterium]